MRLNPVWRASRGNCCERRVRFREDRRICRDGYYDTPKRPANDDAHHKPESRLAPKPLRDLMQDGGLQDIKWKSLVPGLAVHDVLGDRKRSTGDRMYLLRAKGGMRLPHHSHHGEEWTLILKGSYTADDNRYTRGDFHIADETTDHAT